MTRIQALTTGFKSGRCPVTKQVSPNVTKDFVGYHISYNPSSSDYGCRTTALVIMGRVFLVLNGDHKDGLVEACDATGFQGALDYFLANIAQANKMSEHFEIAGVGQDVFGLQKTALEVMGQTNIDRFKEAVAAQLLAAEATDIEPD